MDIAQKLIDAVVKADSPQKLIEAVKALANAQLETGISTLITVLGYNNPGAALLAAEGLIAMGDKVVTPLLTQIDGYNYGARAYAIRTLAAIAHPSALEQLLKAAAFDFAPSVRRAAAKGLGNLRWQELPPEQISEAQAKAITTLLQICQDDDWSIRYAAIVGLDLLTKKGEFPQIMSKFKDMVENETDVAVIARIKLAISIS